MPGNNLGPKSHARKTKHLSAEWRQKIQVSMILNRLQGFINGEIEMSAPQVTAALGLLKKTLPDLSQQQFAGAQVGDDVAPIRFIIERISRMETDT